MLRAHGKTHSVKCCRSGQYSPDLNPIEQLFSKLKALLRKAAERTIPRLLRKIRSLLRTVSADECLNFFRHSGYASN
jgi:transposase